MKGFGALNTDLEDEESKRKKSKDQNGSPSGGDSHTEIVPLFTETGTKQNSG